MPQSEKKPGLFSQIIAAIIIALVAGGTAPWWWEKLFSPQPASATDPSAAKRRSITGTWLSGTGVYKVTQEGNQVVWDGIGRYGNKVWHHRATGTIVGDTIDGTIEELPDSNFPGLPGGAKTEGTISSDWQTITWTGQNDQERVWHRR